MKGYLILIILYAFSGIAFAKPVYISGNAPEYKNTTISFNRYTDYITREYREIASTEIDSSGNFSLAVETETTLEIFTILGVFKAYLFIEPGKKYEVVLPPRKDKTLIHELDLYFEEEEMSLGVTNANEKELNYLISKFNNTYEQFLSESFNWLYIFKDKPTVDSIEHVLDSICPSGKNNYFAEYKYYKYALLRHFVYERNRLFVTNKYLKDKPILYNNPAYMHFFNQVWNGYFTTEYSSEFGEKLYQSIIFGKSPYLVKKYFNESIALRNNSLNELILLRGIFDAFDKPEIYPREALFQTLDSVYLTTEIDEHKIMSKNIAQVEEAMEIGDVAYNFSLPNQDSTIISLNDFKGKFVYLNFCRSESYTCMQDYRLLKTIQDTYMDDLQIITVSNDENYGVFCSFLERNKDYNWTFVFNKNKDLLKKVYNIKAMPAYILLDPDGKVAVDPTLSPNQDFISQFGQIMKWKKRVEESEKTDDFSIFDR